MSSQIKRIIYNSFILFIFISIEVVINHSSAKDVPLFEDDLGETFAAELLRVGLLFENIQVREEDLERWLPRALQSQRPLYKAKLEQLVESGSLRKTSDQSGETYQFSLSEADKIKCLQNQHGMRATLSHFSKTLAVIFSKNWEDLIQYVHRKPHVITIAENYINISSQMGFISNQDLPTQIHLLEYYMYAVRDHEKALNLYARIEDQSSFEDLAPEIQALYVSNSANLVSTHFPQDKLKVAKALSSLSRAYDIFLEQQNYPEALRILSCWAQVCVIQGDLDEAISLLDKGDKLLSKVDSSRYRGLYYYISAWCHLEFGRYKKALFHIQNAIEQLEYTVISPLHFFSRNMKAELLFLLGDRPEAFDAASQSIRLSAKFNSDKPADWKAEALVTMAKCCLELGQLEKAESYIHQSEKEYSEFFGGFSVHVDQAEVPFVFGRISYEREDYSSAATHFLKSLSMYSKILDENAWFDGESMVLDALLSTWLKLMNKEKAIECLSLHMKKYGESHPRSEAMRKRFDSFLSEGVFLNGA